MKEALFIVDIWMFCLNFCFIGFFVVGFINFLIELYCDRDPFINRIKITEAKEIRVRKFASYLNLIFLTSRNIVFGVFVGTFSLISKNQFNPIVLILILVVLTVILVPNIIIKKRLYSITFKDSFKRVFTLDSFANFSLGMSLVLIYSIYQTETLYGLVVTIFLLFLMSILPLEILIEEGRDIQNIRFVEGKLVLPKYGKTLFSFWKDNKIL